MEQPKTLNDALKRLVETQSENDKWEMLALILREFMLAEGIDLTLKIDE